MKTFHATLNPLHAIDKTAVMLTGNFLFTHSVFDIFFCPFIWLNLLLILMFLSVVHPQPLVADADLAAHLTHPQLMQVPLVLLHHLLGRDRFAVHDVVTEFC